MDLEGTGQENVNWIHWAQHRDQWQALACGSEDTDYVKYEQFHD
jgi:hypothetical protein